jgi:hypothetical protein
MEEIDAVVPSPIGWSPEVTRFRSEDPSAWNPIIVVVIVVPGPIPRGPNVSLAGAQRLFIDRESRRTEPHRDSHLRE